MTKDLDLPVINEEIEKNNSRLDQATKKSSH